MKYQDDLLNVYGLLRKKSLDNLAALLEVAKRQKVLEEGIHTFQGDLQSAEEQLRCLSEQLGLDMPPAPYKMEREATQSESQPLLRIQLPPDFDFTEAYRALVKEANEKGFVGVTPEDLLSEEDIRHAEERRIEIDRVFAKETGLREKDIGLLMIAAAVKVTVYAISSFAFEKGRSKDQRVVPVPAGPHQTGTQTDGALGLELSNLRELKSLTRGLFPGGGIPWDKLEKLGKFVRVSDRETILTKPVPFDLPDNPYFSRDDILGYDAIMGWVFGVLNFMTNTVTTKKLESFSVVNTKDNKIRVGEKLSTPFQLLPAVIQASQDKDAVMAAVIREAEVLQVTSAPPEMVYDLMEAAISNKRASADFFFRLQSAVPMLEEDLSELLQESKITGFLDLLTAALCSVIYDPETDGEARFYAVRMKKVMVMANAFAAIANSAPALLMEEFTQIDYAGLVKTLLDLFHTTAYWIQVKTEYLVSEHKKIIDNQLRELDKYFVVETL